MIPAFNTDFQTSNNTLDSIRDQEIFDQFIKDHGVINGVTFVTKDILKNFWDPTTNQIDHLKFENWINTRAHIAAKYPTTSDAKIDLSRIFNKARKPCKRDLSKFGFPEVPLTPSEKEYYFSRTKYKFQTPTYIAYIHQDIVDFITENDLYNPAESELTNLCRRVIWGNSDDKSYEVYKIKRDTPPEYNLVCYEKSLIVKKAEKALELVKKRKSRNKKIRRVVNEYMTISHQKLRNSLNYFKSSRFKVLLFFFSFNLIAKLFYKIHPREKL